MNLFIILAAAILPALVLVYFIYRKDKYEKEPADLLLKGFGFGALAALASFLISFPLTFIGLNSVNAVTVSDSIKTAVFGAAIPEEVSKFFFLWLLLKNNRHFNEYVDGIVYAVCVGMGFAALENILYLLSNLDNWAVLGVTRGLFSVPAHFFFAVLMGYYYSKATFEDQSKRKRNIVLALLIPIVLHAAFDGLLFVARVAVGAAGSLIMLFLGLYTFMAFRSKKRFQEHLAMDEKARLR